MKTNGKKWKIMNVTTSPLFACFVKSVLEMLKTCGATVSQNMMLIYLE